MNYDGEVIIGTKLDTDGIENDIDKLKKDLADKKSSKRIGENDIGEKLVEGIAFGIKKNAYQATEAMDAAMKELKLKRSVGLVDEEEYYAEMENLRDKYFEKGSLGWWNYTAEIIGYETKVYNEQQKNLEKTFDAIEKRVEEFDRTLDKSVASYERKMESLANKEEKFSKKLTNGDFVQKLTFSTGDDAKSVFEDGVWKRKSADEVSYSLNDFKGEIALLSTYNSLLDKLTQKENLPDDILESLKGMDAQNGIGFMSALLNLSDEDYENYLGNISARSEISDKIAKTLYNREAQQIKEEFLGELNEAFGNVNENFLECGKTAATAFGNSFGAKIEEILNSIKATIESELESIECSFSVDVSSSDKGNTRIYNLYGSGETTAQKLQAARADAELENLRGGY